MTYRQMFRGVVVLLLSGSVTHAQTITQIVDSTGDGTQSLDGPRSLAVEIGVEGSVNVFAVGVASQNVFRITPGGGVRLIADVTGDGVHGFHFPRGAAVDAAGSFFFAGTDSSNAFRVEPDGTVTQIIDSTGDGIHDLHFPRGLALDGSGNVYVAGSGSDNAFKIEPDGTITQIIDSTGDGIHALAAPFEVSTDAAGNVYVAGESSNNAFKIEPDGTVIQIIDSTGDGAHSLGSPRGISADRAGNVYVAGYSSHNAFKIEPGGGVTQIVDSTGDGIHDLSGPLGVASDAAGTVYVACLVSDNAFKIEPDGTTTQIIDSTGDGSHGFEGGYGIAVEGSGVVYVAGFHSDNVFRITPEGPALSEVAGLIVPGFDVEDPDGPTTFYAVRNTTDQALFGNLAYYGVDSEEPVRTDAFGLDPRETLVQNLRDEISADDIGNGLGAGYVVVTEASSTSAPHLAGDYFRIDDDNDFATGERMVRVADFCLHQEVRFVDFGSGSQLRILLNRPRGSKVPSFSYTACDQAGTIVVEGDVTTSNTLLVLDIGALVPVQRFGTVVFDFASAGGGWASAKYSAFGRYSVELNADCRDPD